MVAAERGGALVSLDGLRANGVKRRTSTSSSQEDFVSDVLEDVERGMVWDDVRRHPR